MTSYMPGSGLKKPLNMLENPIKPDIKKALPRFRLSGKHWTVGSDVVRDTEHITQFYDNAVLAQSRDYNKTVYGQSSHRDVVNAEFRPPLLDPYLDFYPLTRIPATIEPIEVRINPSSDTGFSMRNERPSDIKRHITDKVTTGNWRPSFYCPIDMPEDNSILPDLELTIPNISATAGFKYPTFDAPHPEVHLDFERLNPKMDAGYNPPVKFTGSSGNENIDLKYNRPQVSVDSRKNIPVYTSSFNGEETRLDLKYNRPQVSVDSRKNIPVYTSSFNGEETRLDLEYNRPQVSVDSRKNIPVQINGYNAAQEIELETKLEPVLFTNPGSEDGYKTRMYPSEEMAQGALQEGNPKVSYVASREQPVYRDRNVLTHKPKFRSPLQPLKRSIVSGGAFPQDNISVPQVNSRHFINKPTRKATYKF